MNTFRTEIDIQADAAKVWATLTQDMPRAPERFGILRIEGTIAPAAKLKLWSDAAPNRAFSLKVTLFEPPHRMIWRGGMPFGLFVGTRTFSITETGTDSRFQMEEVFSGPLAGVIAKSIPDLTPSFIKFANTLKQKAEQNE